MGEHVGGAWIGLPGEIDFKCVLRPFVEAHWLFELVVQHSRGPAEVKPDAAERLNLRHISVLIERPQDCLIVQGSGDRLRRQFEREPIQPGRLGAHLAP